MAKPIRGAVIVAVKKTGQLPELQTVHSCAEQMASWAKAQGIPKSLVKVITDAKKPVDAKQIRDAVAERVRQTHELGPISTIGSCAPLAHDGHCFLGMARAGQVQLE